MDVFGKGLAVSNLYAPISDLNWQVGDLAGKGEWDNLLLQSFSIEDTESIDVRRCFGGVNHIFSFGRDVNRQIMKISLVMVIGEPCVKADNVASFADIEGKYEDARIYKHTSPQDIVVGELAKSGYLISLDIGSVNPNDQTCVITVTAILDQEA